MSDELMPNSPSQDQENLIKDTSVGGDLNFAPLQTFIYNYFYREEARISPAESADSDAEAIPCPYRGLFHFGPNDAEFFFGREVFVEELHSATKTRNFISVLGASGCGKSSVVLAGLAPKLQKEGRWQITHFRPGLEPFHALAEALVPLYELELDSTDQINQARKLARYLSDASFPLSDVLKKIQQKHPDDRVLLIADQFEEIYDPRNNEETRRNFLDCLFASLGTHTSLSSSATVLVTTMRVDFLGNALSYRPFADALQNPDLKLGSMNREELSLVIEKPATLLGVTFESGLVERILNDVMGNQSGNLPLLEFALTELWNKRTGKQLTHKVYKEVGQVKGALARHADDKYGKLTDDEKEKVKHIFIQLVHPGAGTEDTRRISTKSELEKYGWSLVKQLADARLVVTSRNATNQETVEVVHEALISNWQELRGWMDANRTFRSWQERLRSAKEQWEIHSDALLRGAFLAEAREKLRERPEDLISEKEFIERSIKESDRSTTIRWVILVTGFAILTLAAVGFSLWQQQQSQKTLEAVEAIFLGTDTNEILSALPQLHEQANKFKRSVDQLPDTADDQTAINYYQKHQQEINRSFAYYRRLLTVSYQLQKTIEGRPQDFPSNKKEQIHQEISMPAEASLVQMIHKYRIPELKYYLKQRQFGNRKPNSKTTEFENRYTPGALQITYSILERESGAGADLNKNGLIDTQEEANLMPAETLKEIEKLWRDATDQRCGWLGEESPYADADCELGQDKGKKFSPVENTLMMLVIGIPNEAIDQIEKSIKYDYKLNTNFKSKKP